MLHTLVGVTLFMTFLMLAASVAWGRSNHRRRRTDVFIAFSIAVTLAIGLGQRRSFFPFHMWTLFGPQAPDTLVTTRVVALDADGNEHAIDFRAWEPISWWELGLWFDFGYSRMHDDDRAASADFLIRHAEAARRAARSGERFRRYDRILGPFAFPLFHTYKPAWTSPEHVPAAPFVGLRWYHDRHVIRGDDWRTAPPTSQLQHEYRVTP